ncbi:hypothetical protein [Euzebya sp.]|uniref:hypothetical protein n=1 Tax=Euzebya sp. TaxID=1971409 RepID=UPI0035150B5E
MSDMSYLHLVHLERSAAVDPHRWAPISTLVADRRSPSRHATTRPVRRTRTARRLVLAVALAIAA